MNTSPVRHDLTLAYRVSSVIAILMAVVSVVGLTLGPGGIYAGSGLPLLGVTAVAGGLPVPGWLGQDAFNLVVGLPILLALWRFLNVHLALSVLQCKWVIRFLATRRIASTYREAAQAIDLRAARRVRVLTHAPHCAPGDPTPCASAA